MANSPNVDGAIVTPHGVRSYPRDSVHVRYGLRLQGGLGVRLVLAVAPARRDTVFRRLSPRDVYGLAPRLRQLLGSAGARLTLQLNP